MVVLVTRGPIVAFKVAVRIEVDSFVESRDTIVTKVYFSIDARLSCLMRSFQVEVAVDSGCTKV
jgi:hypothetical protein